MYCMNCGKEVPSDARFCRSCGASQADATQASGRASAAGVPGGGPTGRQTLRFDAMRWGRGDMICGGATLLLFISLFLPWFSAQIDGLSVPGLSVDALTAHGWMYVTLLLALAVIGYLIARAVYDGIQLPVIHWQALAGATGVVLLLVLVAFLDEPAGFARSVGAFVGLLAAIAAAGGAVLVRSDEGQALDARPPRPPASAGPVSSVVAPGAPVSTSTPVDAAPPAGDIAARCPSCDDANPVGNSFCTSCGAALDDAEGAMS